MIPINKHAKVLFLAVCCLQLSSCMSLLEERIGFIDSNFLEKLPSERDEQHFRIEILRGFSDGVAWGTRSDGQFVLLDHNGITKSFTGIKAERVSDFSEGVAAVGINSITEDGAVVKLGFVDKDLNWRIPPRFTDCKNFAEGVAAVKIDDAWGFIDRNGKVVIGPRFQSASIFSEGLCEVSISTDKGIKSGFIDHSGNFEIAPKFERLYAHLEKKANLENGELVSDGLEVTMDGRPLIEYLPAFSVFKSGIAPVSVRGRIGFIDHSGKFVIEPKYVYASSFSEGLAIVSNDAKQKFGFIDNKGKVAIPEKFRFVLPFKSGLACGIVGSQITSKFSYFNRDGVKQGAFSSYCSGSFSEGLAPFGLGTLNPPGWNRKEPMSFSM